MSSSEFCVESRGIELCSPLDWREVLLSKTSGIKVHSDLCIGTKLSLYRFLVLKLLRIRALRSQRGLVVWGIPRGKDVSECSDVVLVDLNEADWLKIYSKRIPKLIALPLSEPLRVLVFIAVGVSGILINLACAHIVHGLLSGYGLISYPVASTSGFESSVLWNFTLHEKVTFRGTGLDRRVRSVFVRLVKYHIASIGSWITQVSMATTLPLLLRTPFLLAQFVGIVLGFAVNFILGYIYTWSMHRVK